MGSGARSRRPQVALDAELVGKLVGLFFFAYSDFYRSNLGGVEGGAAWAGE